MGHLMGFLETAKPRGKLRPSRRGLLFTLLPTLPRAAAQVNECTSLILASVLSAPFSTTSSPTLAQCPCTLTSFPRADAKHSGEHPLKEKLPEALWSETEASWGQNVLQ